jgi:hypothetical protein
VIVEVSCPFDSDRAVPRAFVATAPSRFRGGCVSPWSAEKGNEAWAAVERNGRCLFSRFGHSKLLGWARPFLGLYLSPQQGNSHISLVGSSWFLNKLLSSCELGLSLS